MYITSNRSGLKAGLGSQTLPIANSTLFNAVSGLPKVELEEKYLRIPVVSVAWRVVQHLSICPSVNRW